MRKAIDREDILILIALAAILIFQVRQLRPLHGWSDDGSMYILHAQNLLEGRPYADTPASSPSTSIYPPVVPVLLMPVLAWRGLDWIALKLVMMAVFAASAVAVALAFKPLARPWERLFVILVIFANFEYWRLSDHVNSDFLFLAMLAVFAWFTDRSDVPGAPWGSGAAAGVWGALLMGTRMVGGAAFAALGLATLWRWMRPTRFTVVCGVVAGLLVMTGSVAMRSATYYQRVGSGMNLVTIRKNFIDYPLTSGELFVPGKFGAFLICVVGLIGFWRLARERKSIWYTFALVYFPLMVFWPASDPYRFGLPVFPVVALAVLRGFGAIGERLRVAALPAIAAAAALAFQIPIYARFLRAPEAIGLNNAQAMELYRFVKERTPRDAKLACRKPRTLALLTERRSLNYELVPPLDMGRSLCAAEFTHVVSAPGIFTSDAVVLEPYLRMRKLPKLFENSEFAVYDLGRECGLR